MNPILLSRRWAALPRLLPLFVLVSVAGCSESKIRAYSAPKDTSAPAQARATTSTRGPSADELFPNWELPDGWQALPGSGMRYATVLMGEDEMSPEIRVTPLGAMAGEPLANVNRWRQQIGLEPIVADQLGTYMRTVSAGDHMADLVRLTGNEGDDQQQILAAILPAGERVWFFMAMGPPADIAPHADDFDRFVQSVRMRPLAHAHPPMEEEATPPPATSSSSTGSGELAWTLPPGWVEVENSSTMRLATFRVGSGENAGELTITRFPGDVGGELANVNRWRGQIGMAPVTTMSKQESVEMTVSGSPAKYLDLTGDSSRMLVVSVAHGDLTWFLKLSGPVDVLGNEKAHFESFVGSVQLPGAS